MPQNKNADEEENVQLNANNFRFALGNAFLSLWDKSVTLNTASPTVCFCTLFKIDLKLSTFSYGNKGRNSTWNTWVQDLGVAALDTRGQIKPYTLQSLWKDWQHGSKDTALKKKKREVPLEEDTVNEATFPSLSLFIIRYTASEGYWWQKLVACCSFILLVFCGCFILYTCIPRHSKW